MGRVYLYRAALPQHCPSADAIEQAATLFRVCRSDPPTEEDFRPHNESDVPEKASKADPQNCAGWGLSVWTDADEMVFARENIMTWMKRQFVFQCEVAANEGRLSAGNDNGHHTYWPYENTDLLARSALFLHPEGN